MPVGEKQTLRFGPFQLDTQCGQLHKNGLGIKLQGQPVQILEILLEHPGELVTREELRQRLWSTDTFVDFDHSLNAAMQRLRQALGDDAGTPIYIETIPKRGYRFIGEVTHKERKEQNLPSSPIVDETVAKIAATLADTAISASQQSRSLRLWRITSASVLVFLWLVAAIYWVTMPPPMPRIVGSHALTETGFRKPTLPKLVTDGKSIYFQEYRPAGTATVQVGVGGGEVSQVSVSANDVGSLRDISEDGSQLLLAIFDPKANHYDAWIQPLPTGSPRRILNDARWPVWSKDGQNLFFIRNDQELYRANADGTGAQRLAVLNNIFDLAISPDGRRLRFQNRLENTLWEINADGSSPHPILSKPGGVFFGGWRPDGKFFFFTNWGGDHGDLWAISETRRWLQRKTVATQLTAGPVSFRRPAISKDGKHLYVAGVEHHGELSVYDSKRRQFVPYLSGLAACYVDFSRDGQWIAYVSFPDGKLWRSRINGTERMQLTSPPIAVVNPRWSPDGKLIAFNDVSGGDRRLLDNSSRVYVVSAEGGAPMLLPTGDPRPLDPTWSADGKEIAYGIGGGLSPIDIRILNLSTQKWTKVPGSESFYSPRWSPDGKYLVALAGSPASRLMIFSFATQIWEVLAPGTFIGWPAWSKDSKYIFAEDNSSELIRIGAVTHRKELIANIAGFRSTAYYFWGAGWWGVTPDGKPITTRDTSLEEIYALDLEYK